MEEHEAGIDDGKANRRTGGTRYKAGTKPQTAAPEAGKKERQTAVHSKYAVTPEEAASVKPHTRPSYATRSRGKRKPANRRRGLKIALLVIALPVVYLVYHSITFFTGTVPVNTPDNDPPPATLPDAGPGREIVVIGSVPIVVPVPAGTSRMEVDASPELRRMDAMAIKQGQHLLAMYAAQSFMKFPRMFCVLEDLRTRTYKLNMAAFRFAKNDIANSLDKTKMIEDNNLYEPMRRCPSLSGSLAVYAETEDSITFGIAAPIDGAGNRVFAYQALRAMYLKGKVALAGAGTIAATDADIAECKDRLDAWANEIQQANR